MNSVKIIATHITFETYQFEKFEFKYDNVTVTLEIDNKKFIATFVGRKSVEKIMKVYQMVYDVIFLMLGGFPKRECVIVNDIEISTSEWVRKYD